LVKPSLAKDKAQLSRHDFFEVFESFVWLRSNSTTFKLKSNCSLRHDPPFGLPQTNQKLLFFKKKKKKKSLLSQFEPEKCIASVQIIP
jgi:hypothetical protein